MGNQGEKEEGTGVGRRDKKDGIRALILKLKKRQLRKYHYCKKRGGDILRQEGKVLTNF